MSLRVSERPGSWWLETLKRRAANMPKDQLALSGPPPITEARRKKAAIKFFNAAYRAEQSGINQAHQLAHRVSEWDPELAEILKLYGDEEGWHRELLQRFLAYLGGDVQPMGRVTKTLFKAHARARRMETIVLTNLMFETIGSTTYRLTLSRIEEPVVRDMLTILTRDESFHVPLNVYFLRRVLERGLRRRDVLRLKATHQVLFVALVLLPLASRPKSQEFDGIATSELMRAYAKELAALFLDQPHIPLAPPWWLLRFLGISPHAVRARGVTSEAAAERAADREQVLVSAL